MANTVLLNLTEELTRGDLCCLLSKDEPMARHTTLQIGGPADLFAIPRGARQAADCLALARELGVPVLVIGNGSNLLVSDYGIAGMVLCLRDGLTRIEIEGTRITAGAGVLLSQLAATARDNALTGLEFAAGIPGTVGGGVLMNCGAYGGEMKDVLESSLVVDLAGEVAALPRALHRLSYRHSALMESGDIVLASTFLLAKGDRDAIAQRMEELAQQRREKQPLQQPSAGSTFKRPQGAYAAQLIDQAGLKGLRVGDAMVSEKHAGFLVNLGQATCRDMLELMERVRRAVLDHSGIALEPEVRFVGRPME